MPWRGPGFDGDYPSLGRPILDRLWESLPSPSDIMEPLVLTPEQAKIVMRWYGMDDRGAFVYRRGILEMAKGWGKSPLLASIAIAELSMDVLFAGWDANGEPVGRPWGSLESAPPWVQIAAVSEDQTDNTYDVLYEMLVANEHRAAIALGIDQGRTRLYLHGRAGRLEPVTASAGSREGQRVTFAVLDETHLWTRLNKGVKLARTIRRNAAKMGGRTFETTNAPELGEKSVAETSGTEAEAGEPGILHYAKRPDVEPDPSWDDEALKAALNACYGDAGWIDRDRMVAEIRDPATPWTDALRYYFNIRVAGAGRAVDPRRWDYLADAHDVEPGTVIGIGFEASTSTSAACIRACTADGYSFLLGYWAKPPGALDWSVPRGDVAAVLERAFDTYKVGLMLCDPPMWRTEIENWAVTWGDERVLALETNQPRRFAPAVDRWLTALRQGTHTHDDDDDTRRDVVAAHLRKARVNDPDDDSRVLHVLIRGEEGRSIAAAVADVLALEAAATMSPPTERAVAVAWV